jgi:hypothetical protein
MKRFPKDCNIHCEHYYDFDMSVDDIVAGCRLLGQQCDLCDEDFSYTLCPLESEGEAK